MAFEVKLKTSTSSIEVENRRLNQVCSLLCRQLSSSLWLLLSYATRNGSSAQTHKHDDPISLKSKIFLTNLNLFSSLVIY